MGLILLVLGILISFATYQGYGLGWDEHAMRRIGKLNRDYIFNADSTLLSVNPKDYGPVFELTLIFIEDLMKIESMRDIFLMRHLVTHLFFLIGAWFLYRLVYLIYENKWLAAIAFLMLLLHPRIYGQSFVNSKDIPFMVFLAISFYYAALALRRLKWTNFLYLGIALGLTLSIRIMAVLPLIMVLAFLIIDIPINKKPLRSLVLGSVLLVSLVLIVYSAWPYLWTNPVENFTTAFKNMSKFRWKWEILFKGDVILSTDLPWDYIPHWFLISTPIWFIVLGVVGIGVLIFKIIKRPENAIGDYRVSLDLFFFLNFIGPIVAVILFGSVLYDDWRHLYFIYPAFVLLGISGLKFLIDQAPGRLIYGISAAAFLHIGILMVIAYPYQLCYFNSVTNILVKGEMNKRYDLDYWGTSFKEAFETILVNEGGQNIPIAVGSASGRKNLWMLEDYQSKRISIVSRDKAKYFITTFRWNWAEQDRFKGMEFASIKAGSNTICQTFKLK